MALPMKNDFVQIDEGSGWANSVEDYKVTCIEFIKDISGSYLEWVDLYSKRNEINMDEDKKRRSEISGIIEKTNNWIAKVAQTIKGVDVVMNDGIQ
mgnify:CR=1 FL=1